jgi:hypothetical protein
MLADPYVSTTSGKHVPKGFFAATRIFIDAVKLQKYCHSEA